MFCADVEVEVAIRGISHTAACCSAVRTGYAYQPPACCTYRVEAQGSLPRGRHHTVRAPASGLLYVPRTVAPQVLAKQMQRGQLMGHERAEAMDEMSLLQLGLSAMPRVTHTAWFDMSIGGEARGRCQKAPRNTHPFFEHLGPDFVSVA